MYNTIYDMAPRIQRSINDHKVKIEYHLMLRIIPDYDDYEDSSLELLKEVSPDFLHEEYNTDDFRIW